MKTLLKTLVFVVMLSTILLPQGRLRILEADTLSNTTTHTFEMHLGKIGALDSIVVSVFCSGEIDIDTIYVWGGLEAPDVPYVGSSVDIDGGYELIEGATMTIDLADGIEGLVQKFITLTAYELEGYNNLKFYVVGAASGCSATDTDQKFLLYVEVFQPIRYTKEL